MTRIRTLLTPDPDISVPDPGKGSIIEFRDEKHEEPAMRGPFLVDTPVSPETGEKTLFPGFASSVIFRAIYCGVGAGLIQLRRPESGHSDMDP